MTPEEKKQALAVFQKHLPMAQRLALSFLRKFSKSMSDEVLAAANAGLWDAARKYAARPEQEFQALAIVRIRGAMLDEVRSIDWLPRRARKSYGGSFCKLSIEGLGDYERQRVEGEMALSWDVATDLDARAQSVRLQQLVDALPWRDALILRSYLGGETQRSIGNRLSISEPRVNQILSRISGSLALSLRRHRLKVPPGGDL